MSGTDIFKRFAAAKLFCLAVGLTWAILRTWANLLAGQFPGDKDVQAGHGDGVAAGNAAFDRELRYRTLHDQNDFAIRSAS